jgi:ribosomal protein S25
MFQKIANFEKKIKAKKALKNKRKEAHKLNELNFLTRKNEINSSSFNDEVGIVDEVTTEPTATEQIAQKTKINQDVFRYFLQDDSKKGICSAQIKRICGNKAIWKRSLNGKKNQYVSGIEGMKSDKVDEVMAKFKNLETYFVKSPYKAKIWSKQ